MKIFGLLDLGALFIFEKYGENFENSVNAAYKMCEDGANGIVIKGNFGKSLNIYNFLKDRVDLPLTIFVRTEEQYKVSTGFLMLPIFSDKPFSGSIRTISPGNMEFLKKKKGDAILLLNKRLLKLFSETEDFIPELIATVSYRMAEIGYDYMLTSEPLSARKGLRLFLRSR